MILDFETFNFTDDVSTLDKSQLIARGYDRHPGWLAWIAAGSPMDRVSEYLGNNAGYQFPGADLSGLDKSQLLARGYEQHPGWTGWIDAGSPMDRVNEFLGYSAPALASAPYVSPATLNPAPEAPPAITEPSVTSWLDTILLPSESAPVPAPTSLGSLTSMNAPSLSTVVTNELVDGAPVDAPAISPVLWLAIGLVAYWLFAD